MDYGSESREGEPSNTSNPPVNYDTKPSLSQRPCEHRVVDTANSSVYTVNSSLHTENNSVPSHIHELSANNATTNAQELDGRPVHRLPSCLRAGHNTNTNNTNFLGDVLGERDVLPQATSTGQERLINIAELDIARSNTPELDGREVSRARYVESLESSRNDFNSTDVNLSEVTIEEYAIEKAGIKDKLWLGFKNLDNKLDTIYVKYHNLGKRKIYWNLWEKHRSSSQYSSYEEFKREWNPDKNIWSSMAKEFNSDLKKEVNDLMSRRRPFDNPLENVNRRPINNSRYRHGRTHR